MFYQEVKSGIKYFKSSVLDDSGLVHGFSTRIGGNDPEPVNSFTLGSGGVEEFEQYADKNRKKFCDALGLNHKNLIMPEQKHTSNIQVVTSIEQKFFPETDGLITNIPDIPIMLLFADCVPVIMYSPKYKVVGVIHAGWRGTASKIVIKALKIFKERFKIEPDKIKSAIGPAIGQCCYPVSGEVARQLRSTLKNDCDSIFTIQNSEKTNVDLKLLNALQLKENGVSNIDITGDCTNCKNSLFYSYRADGGKTGRHCAVVCLI
jgi:YfiH family protein